MDSLSAGKINSSLWDTSGVCTGMFIPDKRRVFVVLMLSFLMLVGELFEDIFEVRESKFERKGDL